MHQLPAQAGLSSAIYGSFEFLTRRVQAKSTHEIKGVLAKENRAQYHKNWLNYEKSFEYEFFDIIVVVPDFVG